MPKPLPINKALYYQHKIYFKQTKSAKTAKDSQDVWQDKSGISSDRIASRQPASVQPGRRSPHLTKTTPRSQNIPFAKKKAVPIQLWVSPIVKAEVQRQAQIDGLSVSATGAALLEEILRQKLHVQQAATLETVLEKIIAKTNRSLATRLTWLLVRIAFDTGQTRVICTNTLGMQEGMSEESLKEILDTADKRTKANLTRRTPQLTELVAAVEKWLLEPEEGGKTN
ncbi:MAG: hypothetical protein ACREUI_00370 [Burkholderiales bacterium]